GRNGGKNGAPGVVRLDDGTRLRPKGWQHVPAGRRLILELPGGGGYGDPAKRAPEARANDRPKGHLVEKAERATSRTVFRSSTPPPRWLHPRPPRHSGRREST